MVLNLILYHITLSHHYHPNQYPGYILEINSRPRFIETKGVTFTPQNPIETVHTTLKFKGVFVRDLAPTQSTVGDLPSA